MEKLRTFEQYAQTLSEFKYSVARCTTNKMIMRDKLMDLIGAGKLYHERIGDTLWFFSDEDYFYSAHFYVPVGAPIQMQRQDKDVVVDLMGNASYYDDQMDRELVAAGFDKGDKYLEYGAQLDEIIDDVKRQNKAMRAFWEKRGFTIRTATKADYPEVEALWLEKIGQDRYAVVSMTEAELDEMEKYGRCPIICAPEGSIIAAGMYIKKGKIAYGYLTATAYQGSGFGAVVLYEELVKAYCEGSAKLTSWIREDNYEAKNMSGHIQRPSGKFFFQFVCREQQPLELC